MNALQRINTRRLMLKLQNDITQVLSSSNPFFAGSQTVKELVKLTMNQQLLNLKAQGVVDSYVTDVKADKDGKILCEVKFQAPMATSRIDITFKVDKMLNGFFYVKMINGKWCLCMEEDIYKPDYSPMIAEIGENQEWELHTQDAVLSRNVKLDEIMVWAENYELSRSEAIS